ncbi:MAG: excinuclease ABC subunit UvrC, partial [Calditrichaceae bacterium]
MKQIKEKLKNLPSKPGCYLFKDKNGKILYVGKAAILRSRVRSYFQAGPLDPKVNALVKRIAGLEYIITDSEVEALILENNLIKEHKPRYNVNLKDDKSYPYIRITNEDFPQVFITRKVVRDGSKYFGPYTDVKNVRYTLKTLQQIFTIRSCKYNLTPDVIRKKKVDLCLDYYIHKCKGPCQALQLKEDYNREIERVQRFLKGKTDDLVKEIRHEMNDYSERMEFEEAARARDKLNALDNYRNSQKIVYNDIVDRDILAVAKEDDDACAALFKVRESKITGRVHYYMAQVEWQTLPEIIGTFIEQYYFKSDEIPQEIFIQQKIENKDTVEDWLSDRLDKRV